MTKDAVSAIRRRAGDSFAVMAFAMAMTILLRNASMRSVGLYKPNLHADAKEKWKIFSEYQAITAAQQNYIPVMRHLAQNLSIAVADLPPNDGVRAKIKQGFVWLRLKPSPALALRGL